MPHFKNGIYSTQVNEAKAKNRNEDKINGNELSATIH